MDGLSRFFYCERSEISSLIEQGQINAWDIVFTSNKYDHKLIIVSDELKQINLNTTSAIRSFDTTEEAEYFLENSPDAIPGEIICILKNEDYIPYLVTLGLDGDYHLKPFVKLYYDDIYNIPTLMGVEISGNKNFEDYGLKPLSNLELDELLI